MSGVGAEKAMEKYHWPSAREVFTDLRVIGYIIFVLALFAVVQLLTVLGVVGS